MTDTAYQTDDSELLTRVKAGDDQAFAELYSLHGRLVHSVALRLLGNHHDAEDVTQQVFVSAWNSRDSLREGVGSLAGWLVTITRRRCADLAAARARTSRTEEAAAAVALPAPPADPARAVEKVMLAHTLATLGEPRTTIVRMAVMDDRRHEDIAETLGLPLGTVKTYIHRARNELRKQLAHLRI